MSRFILTDLMAMFSANKASTKLDNGFIISSSFDVDFTKWLVSQRDYGSVVLRPVIVRNSVNDANTARLEYNSGDTFVSFSKGLYEVEITTSRFDQRNLRDALYAAMALNETADDYELIFIPIPSNSIREDRTVSSKTAAQWYEESLNMPTGPRLEQSLFSSRTLFDFEFDDTMWTFAVTIADNEELIYASIFLREALRDYVFFGNEVKEVLADTAAQPSSIALAARVENAVHNCYKAIEAVSGGNLPKKSTKIVSKFKGIGVDLETEVGYSSDPAGKQSAIIVLEQLRHSRDWKSAHGRIQADRKSTFYELMNFQQLTRFILIDAIRAQM